MRAPQQSVFYFRKGYSSAGSSVCGFSFLWFVRYDYADGQKAYDAGRIVSFDSNLRRLLFGGAEYGEVAECPDLFPLGDKYVLMFSNLKTLCSEFIYGDFDGRRFTPISSQRIENGPCFYAPQSFSDPAGRRIVIGWLYSWAKAVEEDAEYAGALTIPRELTVSSDGKLKLFPVSEAAHLLVQQDEAVQADGHSVIMHPSALNPDTPAEPLEYHGDIEAIDVLRDTKTIEVFINKGEASFSYWI